MSLKKKHKPYTKRVSKVKSKKVINPRWLVRNFNNGTLSMQGMCNSFNM